MKPVTHYAKSGDVNIAYQVVGQGPVDLIYVPGWISNIDMMWVDERISNFLIKLTAFSRLILFDKRGTGLSDRVDVSCTLEERMDDVKSVLDAVGSEKVILFGHSEGGTIACLFAATYPERTLGLITFGIFARRRYSEDYPWAPTPEEREVFYESIRKHWGNSQKMELEILMPSMVHNRKYYNWYASYLRSSASPGAALALAIMNYDADITDVLPHIKAPTLILHRTYDLDSKVEEAVYLESKIPNSKFVELPGVDHFFWVGDTFSVIAEIEEFITGIRPLKVESPEKKYSAEHQDKIDSIKDYRIEIEEVMLKNFQLNLSTEEYAKLCGRSLSTFKRDFKKEFKTTPSKWLKAKRLDYAKTLLLKSNLNVNQVCYESGFINLSHFILAFKKAYQFPPKQFRKAYLGV